MIRLLLPLLIFAALFIMHHQPGWNYVQALFARKSLPAIKPFHQRLFGYTHPAVVQAYTAMDGVARRMIQATLEKDLYGFISFYFFVFYFTFYPAREPVFGPLWPDAGWPVLMATYNGLLFVLLVLVVVADVIETRLHMWFVSQANKAAEIGKYPVQVASIATVVKLWGFTWLLLSWLLLLPKSWWVYAGKLLGVLLVLWVLVKILRMIFGNTQARTP